MAIQPSIPTIAQAAFSGEQALQTAERQIQRRLADKKAC